MENNKYNGFANHATWLVNLWLSESLTNLSTEEIKEVVEDWVPAGFTKEAGLMQDLLQSAIDDIDWRELEEANKSEEEEEE